MRAVLQDVHELREGAGMALRFWERGLKQSLLVTCALVQDPDEVAPILNAFWVGRAEAARRTWAGEVMTLDRFAQAVLEVPPFELTEGGAPASEGRAVVAAAIQAESGGLLTPRSHLAPGR